MSDPPEASPREALLDALEVRRSVRLALAVGAVLGVGVPLFFLVGVAGGRTDDRIWLYPSLAFVVFATSAMLAAVVLVSRRALRLAVHPGALVRRSATGGLAAGGLWLLAALGLAFGPGRPWTTLVDVALPWAALLTPVGLWAVYTRYKRTARFRPAFVGATLLALAGALALADLAAFDLAALLPDVGGGTDPRLLGLFAVAAGLLVGGQSIAAALAGLGTDDRGSRRTPLLLATPALVGAAAFQWLGPTRLALACLAAGLGVSWLGACVALRRVADEEVPAGADPWPVD